MSEFSVTAFDFRMVLVGSIIALVAVGLFRRMTKKTMNRVGSGSLNTKLLPLLQQVVSESLQDAKLFRFNKTNPSQLSVVCIYCSIVEIVCGCMLLLEKNKSTAVPILLRSLLEAYTDFRACIEDPEYYRNMYASFLEQKLRFLKYIETSPQNPYLVGLDKATSVQTERTKLMAEMEKYKKEGRGPLKTRERFARGKLEHEHQAPYWLLCLHSHNNLSAIEDRHLEKHGDDYQVTLFKEEKSEDLVRHLDSLLGILIDSTRRIHSFLETEAECHYGKHQEAVDAIRKEYATVQTLQRALLKNLKEYAAKKIGRG